MEEQGRKDKNGRTRTEGQGRRIRTEGQGRKDRDKRTRTEGQGRKGKTGMNRDRRAGAEGQGRKNKGIKEEMERRWTRIHERA